MGPLPFMLNLVQGSIHTLLDIAWSIWASCFIRHFVVAYYFWGSILRGKSRNKCVLNAGYRLFLFPLLVLVVWYLS